MRQEAAYSLGTVWARASLSNSLDPQGVPPIRGGVENGDNPTKDTLTLIFVVPGDNQFNVMIRIPSSMTLRGFLSRVNLRQKRRRAPADGGTALRQSPRLATVHSLHRTGQPPPRGDRTYRLRGLLLAT